MSVASTLESSVNPDLDRVFRIYLRQRNGEYQAHSCRITQDNRLCFVDDFTGNAIGEVAVQTTSLAFKSSVQMLFKARTKANGKLVTVRCRADGVQEAQAFQIAIKEAAVVRQLQRATSQQSQERLQSRLERMRRKHREGALPRGELGGSW